MGRRAGAILFLLLVLLAACQPEIQVVEVTREVLIKPDDLAPVEPVIVTEQIEVPVEVTRLVEGAVEVTRIVTEVVEVEVTRLVTQAVTEECNCPDESDDDSPPPPSTGRTKIVAHAIDSAIGCRGNERFSKLVGLGFVNEIDVVVYNDLNDFIGALRDPDVIAAVYGGPGDSAEALVELNSFVAGGGRVLMAYDGQWLERNELLQDLFGVSIVRETVEAADDVLVYDASMLPVWLSGQTIGMAVDGQTLRVDAYLASPNQSGEQGFLTSTESGASRLTYLSNSDNSVIFWPRATVFNGSCLFYLYFFDDDGIDSFDNEAASLSMIRLLAE